MQEINDFNEVKELNKKITKKGKQINQFCENTGLKRDYSRERVY